MQLLCNRLDAAGLKLPPVLFGYLKVSQGIYDTTYEAQQSDKSEPDNGKGKSCGILHSHESEEVGISPFSNTDSIDAGSNKAEHRHRGIEKIK